MTHHDDSIAAVAPQVLSKWGFWALLTGSFALILAFAQMVGPMFEPQPSVGAQIGEIAGDIKRNAWNSFLGRSEAASEQAATSMWVYMAMVAPILAVIAIVLSVMSGIWRENWRFAVYGTGLGVAAITVQFLWWIALLMAGAMILVAIIENIGDIFSFGG
ncbi:MAG: hypothetical protein AAGL23_09700 [Pseudomonadota bacterium]